jgi:VanZ family protein
MIRIYGPVFIWALFILLLCGLPGEDLPDIDFWAIDIEDKLAHVAVFGILGVLAFKARFDHLGKSPLDRKAYWLIVSLGWAYAAFTEIMQGLVFVGRFASVKDFIADCIGMLLGMVLARYWFVTRSR